METPIQHATAAGRRLLVAELLSIGSEITVGETRDTNAAELARSLALDGVRIGRLTALPDDRATVRDAFAAGLDRADLVVSTGGLGPTPDDLTREAIAEVCGETPIVQRHLERWLRALWARRGMPFPEMNLKQAWVIPSARPIPNRNGTAPGWWVERPDGRIVVALPGPPREMRAMWADWVLPRLRARGLGRVQVTRTYRLAGIGESQVADLLGEGLLRTANPIVATYARADAVDVRISAIAEHGTDGRPGRPPDELVDDAEAIVLAALGRYVWGRDDDTWPGAIGRCLGELGWTLATREVGTGGTLAALLGGAPWLWRAEALAADAPDALPTVGMADDALGRIAADVRAAGASEVGVALAIAEGGPDTAVAIAVATETATHVERRVAFLGGDQGRSRAALVAAAVLLDALRAEVREADLAEAGG
jgi:nicotinamide-nucleotide amidase